MTLPEQQYLSTCPACNEQIDVTALEPFAKISCPACRESVRVRRKFDHFMIMRQIGEGGMSRVFEAEDETLGRRVALKILNRRYSGDLARMAQFQQEALTTARVTHPNVIKLFSVGFDQGHFFIAMELVSGGSLEQRIKREGQVQEKELLRIGRQVAEGLRAAHRMGLLHRDVKPANILFTDEGTAKVVDFGLALFIQQQDQSGEIWATPFYVSPEKVIENKEDFRSDLFSLGASLYHALTGHPPHKVKSASLHELRMVKCRRVSLEDTGMPFGERTVHAVDELLAFEPDERPQSYDAAVDELRLAEGLTDRAFISLASQRRKLAIVATVGLLVAFVGGWWLKTSNQPKATAARTEKAVRDSLTGGGITLDGGGPTKSQRYLQARAAISQGDWQRGQAGMEELLKEGVMQPTMNWVRFHAALCAMVEGNQERAKGLLRDMAQEDVPGGVFKALATRQQKDLGLSNRAETLKCNAVSEEVLGYLSVGMAHWYFGDPEQGEACFMKFLEAIRKGHPVAWIVEYRQLVEGYARDAKLAAPLLQAGKTAPVQDAKGLLASLEAVRSQISHGGRLLAAVDQRIAELKQRAATQGTQAPSNLKMKEDLARRARELDQLTELTQSLPALVRGYDFSTAIGVLKEMQFESQEVRDALEGKLYLYENSAAFLDLLFQDFRTRGWTGVIQRPETTPLTATVRDANLKEIRLRMGRGEVTLPFASLSPENLLEMAESLKRGMSDSTEVYRREELMASFAKIMGLEDQAAAISTVLMEENRAFRARWMKVLQGGI